MNYKKAVEIMIQLQAEYFYDFKGMPEKLFDIKVKNFIKTLEGYSNKEIDIALLTVLRECKTCPTAANFVEVLERNKELQLPSAEEEWCRISQVLKKMKQRYKDFVLYCDSSCDSSDYRINQLKSYDSLPEDIKDFYTSFSGFFTLVLSQELDIEKNRFLKQFPSFRREKRQRQELNKQMEMKL